MSKPETTSEIMLWADALFVPGDVVEFRCIAKPGGVIKNEWAVFGEDFETVLNSIKAWQGSPPRYTIFIGTNPRKAKGLAGDENITLARSLYVDFDTDLQGNAGCTVEQAQMRIKDANLPPASMVVRTPKGVHAYWLLEENLTNMQKFTAYQLWLIRKLGTDSTIKNPERIMRAPSFECQKRPGRFAELVISDTWNRYSLDEFEALKGAELDKAMGLQIKTPWAPAYTDGAALAFDSHTGTLDRMRAALRDAEYSLVKTDSEANERWLRPGGNSDSDTVLFTKDSTDGFCKRGAIYAHTSNGKLPHGRTLQPFEAWTILRHGGDAVKAFAALAAEGQQVAAAPRESISPGVLADEGDALLYRTLKMLDGTEGRKAIGIEMPGFIHTQRLLSGIAGFCLLTGATGAGKTTFTNRLALNVAEKTPASVVYISAEMKPERLVKGLLAMISGIPKTVLSLNKAGLTADQRAQFKLAQSRVAAVLGKKLFIMGAQDYGAMGWSKANGEHCLTVLQRAIADRVKDTREVLIVIDSLATLDVVAGAGERAFTDDLTMDREMTAGLKRWRNELGDLHGVIAIHEESKARTGTTDVHAGRGSSRYAYMADSIMALTYATNDGGTRDLGLRASDQELGVTEIDLHITKARDGELGVVALDHRYREANVIEMASWTRGEMIQAERELEAGVRENRAMARKEKAKEAKEREDKKLTKIMQSVLDEELM